MDEERGIRELCLSSPQGLWLIYITATRKYSQTHNHTYTDPEPKLKGEEKKGGGGRQSPAGHADICGAIILQMFTDVSTWPGASKHCGPHPKRLAALSTHRWRRQSSSKMKDPKVTPSHRLTQRKPQPVTRISLNHCKAALSEQHDASHHLMDIQQ